MRSWSINRNSPKTLYAGKEKPPYKYSDKALIKQFNSIAINLSPFYSLYLSCKGLNLYYNSHFKSFNEQEYV